MSNTSQPTRPRVSEATYDKTVSHHRSWWWRWLPIIGKRAPKRPNIARGTYKEVLSHWRASGGGIPVKGAIIAAAFLAVMFGLWGFSILPHNNSVASSKSSGSCVSCHATFAASAALASSNTTPSAGDPKMVARSNKALQKEDWEPGQYALGDQVDPSKDRSTAGGGAFTRKGIRSRKAMTNYLKSGKSGSRELVAAVIAATHGTKEEVFDVRNWIEVQSLISFVYPGNTGLNGARIVNAGRRDGQAGDIFLLFISPSTNTAVAVRGACANPQVFIPRPLTSQEIAREKEKEKERRRNDVKIAGQNPDAPEGEGRNVIPGPGRRTSRPPSPPATPRVNPPAPTVSTPPQGSKPDPTPPPPPAAGQGPPNQGDPTPAP